MVGLSSAAVARPSHHHHHHHHHRRHVAAAPAPVQSNSAINDHHYAFLRNEARRRRHASTGRHYRHRAAAVAAAPRATFGGFTSSTLVAEARKYIGTNPTGRRSLWCGAFMDMVLRETGHKGGGNLALGYAHYGHRISGPRVGAIAVMGRRGGGHVGVVAGIDPNGNPIIISGNHNHTVAQSIYPRHRIIAYVEPNG